MFYSMTVIELHWITWDDISMFGMYAEDIIEHTNVKSHVFTLMVNLLTIRIT